jgi:hypothetical protein
MLSAGARKPPPDRCRGPTTATGGSTGAVIVGTTLINESASPGITVKYGTSTMTQLGSELFYNSGGVYGWAIMYGTTDGCADSHRQCDGNCFVHRSGLGVV